MSTEDWGHEDCEVCAEARRMGLELGEAKSVTTHRVSDLGHAPASEKELPDGLPLSECELCHRTILPYAPNGFSDATLWEIRVQEQYARRETAERQLEQTREALKEADELLAGTWSFNNQSREAMKHLYSVKASDVLRRALAATEAPEQ